MATLISRSGFGLQFVRNELTSAREAGNSKLQHSASSFMRGFSGSRFSAGCAVSNVAFQEDDCLGRYVRKTIQPGAGAIWGGAA